MRWLSGISLIFVVTLSTTAAWSFDHEPDGFRGIQWGAATNTAEGLVRHTGTDLNIQAVVREDEGITLKDFPLESYVRPSDKMEFADAEMKQIVYQFYKGRFVRAFLYYPDSRNTPQGDAYAAMHDIGSPPPKYYESKNQVDRGLKNYFGKPTSQPKFILKLAFGAGRIEYKGETTNILSMCKGAKATDCFLVFSSTKIGDELDKDFDAAIAARKAAQKAEQTNAMEKRKAKPDF